MEFSNVGESRKCCQRSCAVDYYFLLVLLLLRLIKPWQSSSFTDQYVVHVPQILNLLKIRSLNSYCFTLSRFLTLCRNLPESELVSHCSKHEMPSVYLLKIMETT